MVNCRIKKSLLRGSLTLPGSKSQTLRAILFSSLSSGTSFIFNPLLSNDSLAMIKACALFGATIEVLENGIQVHGIGGNINFTEDVIDANNSGIVLRFCAAIAALGNHPIVITGDYSIRHQRPMYPLIQALSQLGVRIEAMRADDHAPLIIKGPMKSGKATLEGRDSQYVSALLIAAAFSDKEVELEVVNPGEKPWVLMTLDWIKKLDVEMTFENFTSYKIKGKMKHPPFEYSVPGDLSNVAFPLVAAILSNARFTIYNVDMNDLQGDKEIIDLLMKMGAKIEINSNNQTLNVYPGSILKGVDVDINNFIDAIIILAVVGCFAEGETILRNASIAREKECNRIASTVRELKKMGASIEETEDGLHIKKSVLKGARVNSHGDHRMAMALIVAGLLIEGETIVENIECIEKTYPNFVESFVACGAYLELI